jgi:hypothetical protein
MWNRTRQYCAALLECCFLKCTPTLILDFTWSGFLKRRPRPIYGTMQPSFFDSPNFFPPVLTSLLHGRTVRSILELFGPAVPQLPYLLPSSRCWVATSRKSQHRARPYLLTNHTVLAYTSCSVVSRTAGSCSTRFVCLNCFWIWYELSASWTCLGGGGRNVLQHESNQTLLYVYSLFDAYISLLD